LRLRTTSLPSECSGAPAKTSRSSFMLIGFCAENSTASKINFNSISNANSAPKAATGIYHRRSLAWENISHRQRCALTLGCWFSKRRGRCRRGGRGLEFDLATGLMLGTSQLLDAYQYEQR